MNGRDIGTPGGRCTTESCEASRVEIDFGALQFSTGTQASSIVPGPRLSPRCRYCQQSPDGRARHSTTAL